MTPTKMFLAVEEGKLSSKTCFAGCVWTASRVFKNKIMQPQAIYLNMTGARGFVWVSTVIN